jgi:hypothetical protein
MDAMNPELAKKLAGLQSFLREHGMETAFQAFRDEGYIQPEDVMDMEQADVEALAFLNDTQKAYLLRLLLGESVDSTIAQKLTEVEILKREKQELQERLYDEAGASGRNLHILQQEKSDLEKLLCASQARQEKVEAEVAALKAAPTVAELTIQRYARAKDTMSVKLKEAEAQIRRLQEAVATSQLEAEQSKAELTRLTEGRAKDERQNVFTVDFCTGLHCKPSCPQKILTM